MWPLTQALITQCLNKGVSLPLKLALPLIYTAHEYNVSMAPTRPPELIGATPVNARVYVQKHLSTRCFCKDRCLRLLRLKLTASDIRTPYQHPSS